MLSTTQTNPSPNSGPDNAEAKARVDAACARLRERGLRITQPRIAILGVLIARARPVSIEQIHAEMRTRSCDLVTVYRCLAAFEEIGLVRRSFFHNGTSLYQLADNQDVVYHVVSKNTGEIHPLDVETSGRLGALIRQVEEQLRAAGYGEISHVLEFFAKTPGESSSETNPGKVAGLEAEAVAV